MKKLPSIIAITFFSCILLNALWSSYPLQDGYRLQGRFDSHGQIYKGYFELVIDEEVMGVQGSANGYLFGWVMGSPQDTMDAKTYFILNTASGDVKWFSGDEFSSALKKYGCPKSDMNKEINLAGFKNKQVFHRE